VQVDGHCDFGAVVLLLLLLICWMPSRIFLLSIRVELR
jgi:heme O synthase-like polyprenyltransferase